MRRLWKLSLWVGLLTSLSVGCAAAGDRVDGLRTAAGDLREEVADGTDDAGFCLSLTRAATAIESGSPATAEEATEETLARAPEGIADDARAVAEAVRAARDDGAWDADDPGINDAIDRLTERARQICEPG